MPTTEHEFGVGEWVVEIAPANGRSFDLWRIVVVEISAGGRLYACVNGDEADKFREDEIISMREFEEKVCS